MKHVNTQSGFAVLEAVLIIVIIGILSFTGWFVWNAKQNADSSLDSANKTATSSTNSAAADKQQYLVVKNFGIKLPLSADMVKDLTFIATAGTKTNPSGRGGTRSGYPGQVEFISDKVAKLCGTQQDLQTLFLVNRDDSDTPVATKPVATVVVSGHTYSVIAMSTPDNNGCKNDADKAVFKTTYEALLNGLKKAEAE